MDEKKIPILVGSGQITQREQDPLDALSPMDLTASAGFKAADDTKTQCYPFDYFFFQEHTLL